MIGFVSRRRQRASRAARRFHIDKRDAFAPAAVVGLTFMPHPSPSRAGFDAVVRRPAVLLAEVCWRWCFGITSLTLLAATAILFLGTIRVSDAEMQLAKSGSPWVAADVVALAADPSAPAPRPCPKLCRPSQNYLWL